jgi:LmbE family N-acetylglucosaminyl deacetylase
MGMSEAELTMAVDVLPYVANKRRAIAAHASQVTDSGFFTQMPDDVFATAFGTEWFIEHGREPGLRPGWLFER